MELTCCIGRGEISGTIGGAVPNITKIGFPLAEENEIEIKSVYLKSDIGKVKWDQPLCLCCSTLCSMTYNSARN
jgi:hypothetical protein